MNRTEQSGLNRYLSLTIAKCLAEKDLLRTQGRFDESNFEQIRANVCAICLTVSRKGMELCPDASGFARFFREKTAHLKDQWQNARYAALAHEDAEQALIEDIKLKQIEAVRNAFEQNWSESHD